MTYLQADPNTWYTISRLPQPPLDQWLNVSITISNANDNRSSTFLSPGPDTNAFKWQLYPVTDAPNGTYLLRPETAAGGFMHSFYPTYNNVSDCVARGWDCTIGVGLEKTVDYDGVWTFTNALDGTNSFFITNAGNGSTYHLDIWPNGSWLRMSNNITGTPGSHPAQQYQVIPVGQINNPEWQSIDGSIFLFPDANSTIPNVTFPTTDPSSNSTNIVLPPPPPPPFPTGAKIGTIVAVVLVVLSLLGLLAWWGMRRRKKRRQWRRAMSSEDDSDTWNLVGDEMKSMLKTKRDTKEPLEDSMVEADSEPLVEAPSEGFHGELEGDQPRYELPATRYS